MNFLRYPKFDFNVIFCNFWKVRNRTNSKFSVNSECSETPVSELFPNFLTQKHEIISELISKLFLQNFCEFEKTGYF